MDVWVTSKQHRKIDGHPWPRPGKQSSHKEALPPQTVEITVIQALARDKHQHSDWGMRGYVIICSRHVMHVLFSFAIHFNHLPYHMYTRDSMPTLQYLLVMT